MITCPSCSKHLHRHKTVAGLYWRCPECEGRLLGVGVARKVLDRGLVNRLWIRSGDAGVFLKKRECPLCQNRMVEISASPTEHPFTIDVCRTCHTFWFDPHELADLEQDAPVDETDLCPEFVQKRDLPPKAREMIARYEAESMARRAEVEDTMDHSAAVPDSWWKVLCSVLGLPVEDNSEGLRQLPLMTWGIVLLMVLAFLLSMDDLERVIGAWGFIPAEFSRSAGITWLTSIVLHAGVWHLLSNTYFLLIFGDNVEDYLGSWKYLLLFLLAGIAGCAFHWIWEPQTDIPLVGASGAIAGLITFYGLKFTRAKLTLFLYLRWLRIPAWFALMVWLCIQLGIVSQQVAGVTNISGLAHLGGAVVGLAFWIWSYQREGS